MTPEAVEALRGVASAVEGARDEIAGLSARWVEDMAAAHERDEERFRAIRVREAHRATRENRRFVGLACGLGATLLLILGVLYTVHADANAREDRFRLAQDQARCNAVVADATLARLSDLAIATPNRVNGGGVDPAIAQLRTDINTSRGNPDPALLARIRDEVAAILAVVPSGSPALDGLRSEVEQTNNILLHVADVCYGPNGPDPTPLDGDPTH